jgi:hypothetical protein
VVGIATNSSKVVKKRKKPKKVHQPSLPATEEENIDPVTCHAHSHQSPEATSLGNDTVQPKAVKGRGGCHGRGKEKTDSDLSSHTHSPAHRGTHSHTSLQ